MEVINVKTIKGIIDTFYQVISGEKNQPRNWDLLKKLMNPRAKLIYYGPDVEKVLRVQYWSPEFYANTVGKSQENDMEVGFFEKEIHQVVERFGNIAHVFSTYASYDSPNDKKPHTRGINSFQLLYSDKRWWIINVFWDGAGETIENPIPKKYLPIE